jgi:ATP-binding cassette subfamily B protein
MGFKNNSGRFRIIIKYLKLYRKYLIWGGLAIIGSNALLLMNPYLLKMAFDRLENRAPSREILIIALLIVVVSIISGIFRFSMRRTIIWMSRKIEYDIRDELFGHLLKLNPTFYHEVKVGDIMARATNDIEAARMMIGPGIMQAGNTLVTSIIALGFMLYLSPRLTLFALAPLPIISVAVNRLGQAVHRRFMKIQDYYAILTSRVQENLAGVRVIRAYNQEKAEIDSFSAHNKKYIALNMDMIRINSLFYPLLFMLAGSINIIVFYFGGKSVISGELSLGTLVAFFAYMAILIWPMIALGWVISLYQRGTASLDRINKILNAEPAVQSSAQAIRGKEIKGKIEIRRLDFGYNEKKVLRNVNLTIEPGMTVGVIGPTASGKTTLVSLLSRLYPVPRGMIFIDDIDINDWDLEALRSQIGFVVQEAFLFSETIADNIRFGRADGNGGDLKSVAALAAIDDEIESFPRGYETLVGERGITLSGGQKQRVSIARALMTDPKILILDDAASAVDTETEHVINMRLKNEIKKRTSIIISHRVSAVKDADLIVYLENGTIAESGAHDDLLALDGKYARLYKMQLIEDELKRM